MIEVKCSRTDCEESVEADDVVQQHKTADGYDAATVVLPEGWGWDRIDAFNHVIHCPEHRS